MILIIPLIVLLIIFAVRINSLSNELIKLKEENDMLHRNIYNMASKLNNQAKKKEKIIKQQPDQEHPIKKESIQDQKVIVPKQEINKNNLILVTGSIFIIMASLLFLTSTWNILPNIIKTIVLFLLIFIFLGTSYFAGEKLKVEKTARTFFYIAMIYIPICLYSIGYLGLLGDYFSKDSIGFFLYLTLVFLITSGIYILASKKEQNLLYGNYIFQLLAVFCFGIFLNQGYETIYLLLTFYNLAILIKNVYCKKSKFSHITELVLEIMLSIILIINTTGHIFLVQMPMEFQIPINSILSLLVLLGITIYKGKENNYFSALSELLLIMLTASIITKLAFSQTLNEIIILLTLILIFIKTELSQHKNKQLNWIVLITSFVCLFLISGQNSLVISILIVAVAIIMNIYHYVKTKNIINAALNVWLVTLLYILVVDILNLAYQDFIFLLTATQLLKIVLDKNIKDKNTKKVIEINNNIILLPNLFYFTVIEIFNNGNTLFIIPLLVIITSYVSYKNEKESYQLAITNIALAALLTSINNILLITKESYLSLVIVTLITILYKLITKQKLKEEKVFITLYLVTLLGISYLTNDIPKTIALITIILTLQYNDKYLHNKVIEYLSYIFLTLGLFITDIYILNIHINPILNLILIITWLVKSYLNTKITITDYMTVLYIVLGFFEYTWIRDLLLIVWYFANENRREENPYITKSILYITCWDIYNNILHELELLDIVVLPMIGHISLLFLVTRTMIKNKNSNMANKLEWIISCILYVLAIGMYKDEVDGILFVTLLILIMIIGYKKKIASAFFTSLIFIIINVFLLTREFWFSLPWWLYLLVIGFVLIIFATNNELQKDMKEKKIVKLWKKYFNNDV